LKFYIVEFVLRCTIVAMLQHDDAEFDDPKTLLLAQG